MRRPLLFTTEAYQYMAAELLANNDLGAGALDCATLPGNERYLRIKGSVAGEDVVLLGGAFDPASTLEIYNLAWALVMQGAARLTLVMPYFAYATMDTQERSGEVVAIRAQSQMLSNLPRAPGGNDIILFHSHARSLDNYFTNGTRAYVASCTPFVVTAARALAAGRPFVLATTDAGNLQFVHELAGQLRVEPAAVLSGAAGTQILTAEGGGVQGKLVIIYHDRIRTGVSLAKAARICRRRGASEVHAICTHGIFAGRALELLKVSGRFDQIVVSNSHPHTQQVKHLAAVVEVGALLGKKLMAVLRPQQGRGIMSSHD